MLKINTVSGILSALIIFSVCNSYAVHFKGAESSPVQMHLAGYLVIEGEWAMPGDEVGIFDNTGELIGSFVVKKEGMFGDMAVTGDDELSVEKEGALEGTPLFIRIWRKSTGEEYSAPDIEISSPEEDMLLYTPYPVKELKFDGGMFYLLNIQAAK